MKSSKWKKIENIFKSTTYLNEIPAKRLLNVVRKIFKFQNEIDRELTLFKQKEQIRKLTSMLPKKATVKNDTLIEEEKMIKAIFKKGENIGDSIKINENIQENIVAPKYNIADQTEKELVKLYLKEKFQKIILEGGADSTKLLESLIKQNPDRYITYKFYKISNR